MFGREKGREGGKEREREREGERERKRGREKRGERALNIVQNVTCSHSECACAREPRMHTHTPKVTTTNPPQEFVLLGAEE